MSYVLKPAADRPSIRRCFQKGGLAAVGSVVMLVDEVGDGLGLFVRLAEKTVEDVINEWLKRLPWVSASPGEGREVVAELVKRCCFGGGLTQWK